MNFVSLKEFLEYFEDKEIRENENPWTVLGSKRPVALAPRANGPSRPVGQKATHASSPWPSSQLNGAQIGPASWRTAHAGVVTALTAGGGVSAA
jgi:hypothetical protein